MQSVQLLDLDELALTTRDKISRSYIVEAIKAYRSGAYRSAIMSSWIAVVFDIISKIRELAGQGDGNAIAFISRLENAINLNLIQQLQIIENELLFKAKDDFEFLLPHEFTDLNRLKEDRNLCAHPAFVSEDILFQPTPELVRAHIVHSIVHLLQHQPVQGKSALNLIKQDIIRASFPSNLDDVIQFLQTKYLNRAKDALIRNLIVVLLKGYLKNDDADLIGKDDALINSLIAISRTKPIIYEEILNSKLTEIIDALNDAQMPRLFRLIKNDQKCWLKLGEPNRIRLLTIIRTFTNDEILDYRVFDAYDIEEIKPFIDKKIQNLDYDEKYAILTQLHRPQFKEIAIELYKMAGSFRNAERIGNFIILPFTQFFTKDDVIQVINCAKDNEQVKYAAGSLETLPTFFDRTIQYLSETQNVWLEFIESVRQDPNATYSYPKLRQKLVEHGVMPTEYPSQKLPLENVDF